MRPARVRAQLSMRVACFAAPPGRRFVGGSCRLRPRLRSRYKHLGVASCATSVCHGKLAPQPRQERQPRMSIGSGLNEDRHVRDISGSLESDGVAARSQRNSAWSTQRTAEICLDCHADNAPVALQAPLEVPAERRHWMRVVSRRRGKMD